MAYRLEFEEYRQLAKNTMAELRSPMEDRLHMILGMTTEVAELADVYKKKLAYSKQVDMVNVKEELGDLMWYIANFCTINDIRLDEVMGTNILKLQARYPEKFSVCRAINRDLDLERSILENNEQ